MRFGRRRTTGGYPAGSRAEILFEYSCWTPTWSPDRLTRITPPGTDTTALHAALVELNQLGAGTLNAGQVFHKAGAVPRSWWATVGAPMLGQPPLTEAPTDDLDPQMTKLMVGASQKSFAPLPVGVGNRGSLAEAVADLIPLISGLANPKT